MFLWYKGRNFRAITATADLSQPYILYQGHLGRRKLDFFGLVFVSFSLVFMQMAIQGPGSAVGKKGKKMGSNRKNIGERSEPGGSLGHPYPFPDYGDFFFCSPMRNLLIFDYLCIQVTFGCDNVHSPRITAKRCFSKDTTSASLLTLAKSIYYNFYFFLY